MKDQRALATGFALLGLLSLAGLYAAPGLAMIWVALFGFAIGGAFILALAFIGLRSRSAEQTAQLSGMTQSVGYLMSACGPIAIGALHDAVDAWAPALAACGALCILLVVLGLGAGRDRQVA
jgi:CP family cyanate transporter-like MFS transporter